MKTRDRHLLVVAAVLVGNALAGCGLVSDTTADPVQSSTAAAASSVPPSSIAASQASSVEPAEPTTGEAWSRTPRYSPTSYPAARLPRGLQGLGTVNPEDLQSVCEAYLRTANAWDTRFDRDPSEAGARAAKYTVGPLRTGLLAPQAGGASGAFLTARDAAHGYSIVTSLIPVDGDATVRGDIGSCGFEVVTSVMDGTGNKKVTADSDVLSTLTARRQPSGAWLITDEEVA